MINNINKQKTILLTGATGFLGSNLLKAFIKEGYHVVILKRSFSDTSRISGLVDQIPFFDIDKQGIENAFSSYIFDMIVHCATSYGRKDNEPINLIQSNLIFPLQLLDYGSKQGVACFINTDTILDKRVNVYSLSKKQFKEWLEIYEDKLSCVNVVLEHFYGPNDDISKFVSCIISKMLKNEQSIELTKGEQERDFIYIDDVISAFLQIIKNYQVLGDKLAQIEVGTNKPIKIKDFVLQVHDITKSKSRLNFGAIPYRKNEIMKFDVDTTIIRQLGWKPRVTLKEGLIKTINIEKEKSKL